MGKLLVLIALVAIAFWLLKRALQRNSGAETKRAPPAEQKQLVACAHCGVNLPREEARAIGAELFCSEEHARLGRR